ncbi:MAG: AmmeMemoRadiSam system protein A [Deltaproteobacteria bacterium]|nr:AmmeMemoRadiSam system protein A [Deltaproteobacteria bacterium]
MPLADAEKKSLLNIARLVVETYVRERRMPSVEVTQPALMEGHGAFVSLHKKSGLRGCVGKFDFDTPLYKTVAEMAVSAATQDSRFSPVTPNELGDITIEISALTPLKEVSDMSEIITGRHGIYIVKGFYRGVLLPQVAVELGLGREEFLDHTCLKAGLPLGAWKKDAKIYTFEAEIFKEE